MENQSKAFTLFMACLGGILTGAKAIIRLKEAFLSNDHPLYGKYTRLTRIEES
jgi:hypothetical protein